MTNKLPLILGLLFTTACGEKDPEPSAEPAGEPTAEPSGEPAGEVEASWLQGILSHQAASD